MKQTINFWQFNDAFYKMDREHQFTNKGKKALFEYLEEYEDDTDEQIELDVIALCCDFTEYDKEDFPDIEAIEYNTMLIPINDDAFIIQSF